MYMVEAGLGLLGYNIVGGLLQGMPLFVQARGASNLAANLKTSYFYESGERFWEARMTQMVDKTIANELVRGNRHDFLLSVPRNA